MSFHFIYLAAGFSKRYGGNKLLSIYEGIPLYRVLLDRLTDLLSVRDDVADITVVTQYEEIKADVMRDAAANEKTIRCIINPDPSRGISSSLQCGIEAILESDHQTCNESGLQSDHRTGNESGLQSDHRTGNDFLVCFVADAPKLGENTVDRFLTAFAESGRRLGCIGNGDQMGNPCVFAYEYIPELMALTGDRGGKRVLKRHAEEVFIFSDIKVEELEDIDYKC